MKSVLLGCIAAIALAFGAALALEQWQQPSADAFSTEGVRLSPPSEGS